MKKPSETTGLILKALRPPTEAGLPVPFKPSRFFSELASKTGQKRRSLESAYYRAVDRGLIEFNDKKTPSLTEKGLREASLHQPLRLKFGARLMVVFDIPEAKRQKRRRFRLLLRRLSFRQIRQSVWETEYDYRDYLRSEIARLDLQEHVKIYEAAQIEV